MSSVNSSETTLTMEKPPSEPQQVRLHGKTLWVVSFCMYFSLMLGFLESSAVGTILVSVGKEFNDTIHVQWIVLAYLLTYLGFSIIFSRISDVIGRKWTTVVAASIVTAASVACGLSQNMPQLIVFRAVQGLGGAGLYAMPTIMLPEITPIKHFNLMGGLMGISMTVSAVCGPFIGGAITTHSSWRWVFWVNVPCGAFIVMTLMAFCPDINPPKPLKWKQLDLVGCVLYLATSVLPIFALQQAGSGEFQWTSAEFIVCISSGGVAFALLAIWICYLSKGEHIASPLFPARILKHRVMLLTIIVSLLIGYVFFTIMIQLPERFQIVNGKNPEKAGICLLAVSGASAFGSILGVAACSKKNFSFWTMNLGSVFVLIGTGLLCTISNSEKIEAKVFGFEVLIGFGLGTIVSATTLVIKIEAKLEDAASAQGLTSQARLFGGNVGLAVSTILLNQRITSHLSGEVSPQMLDKLRHSLLALSEANPTEQEQVRQIFSDSFRMSMFSCMCIAGAALLIGLLSFQTNPPDLVQLATDGDPMTQETSKDKRMSTIRCESWYSVDSTRETILDPEGQTRTPSRPRSFWAELPLTPFFADQYVHTYSNQAPPDYWNDPNLLTALPQARTPLPR